MNPLLISRGLALKKWLQKNELPVLSTFKDVVEASDKSGFLAVFEFKFKTKEQARKYMDMYELAKEFEL